MHSYLLEMLECPKCHGKLDWNISEQSSDRIEVAEACCNECSATYPVRDGIGVFLTTDLKRNDLWEQADKGLEQYLKQNPVLEQMLMDVPLETLSPVDQHYRGVILEDRGDTDAAQAAFDIARKGLYSVDTIRCQISPFIPKIFPQVLKNTLNVLAGAYCVRFVVRAGTAVDKLIHRPDMNSVFPFCSGNNPECAEKRMFPGVLNLQNILAGLLPPACYLCFRRYCLHPLLPVFKRIE